MLQQVWMILLGGILGALLIFPGRQLCSQLLKRRGQTLSRRFRQAILLRRSCVSGGDNRLARGRYPSGVYLFLLLFAAAW